MCFEPDSELPVENGPQGDVSTTSLTLTAADGARFQAFSARPARPSGAGVVVLPDVRGLYRFYRDLAVRFAEFGHAAVAIDYFGRTAGIGDRDDPDFPFMDHVNKTTREGVQADVDAAVAYLRSPDGGTCRSVFTVGFCFGGRRSLLAPALGGALTGVVGFYGRPVTGPDGPGPADLAGELSTPVLALFGGADPAIPPEDVSALEAALAAAGVDHEVVTYPGAPHSFFDRKYEEHAEASADAWRRVLAFIDRLS